MKKHIAIILALLVSIALVSCNRAASAPEEDGSPVAETVPSPSGESEEEATAEATLVPTKSPTLIPTPTEGPQSTATPTVKPPAPTKAPTATTSAESEATAEPIEPPAETPEAEMRIHIVQPGENLFRIGLAYDVSWQTLMAANNLDSADDILVGQELVIPGVEEETPTVALITHVVQPGENLYRIGLMYDLTWNLIADANGITDPTAVYAGMNLVIPAVED